MLFARGGVLGSVNNPRRCRHLINYGDSCKVGRCHRKRVKSVHACSTNVLVCYLRNFSLFYGSVRGLPDLTAPSQRLWATNQLDRGNDDEQNSDAIPTATSSTRGARQAERWNRRMRRASGGSRSQRKVDSVANEYSASSPSSSRQVSDYVSRDSETIKPLVLRARRAKPCR